MTRTKHMELFEAVRRAYQFGGKIIKGVARKFRIHRPIVRKPLAGAEGTASARRGAKLGRECKRDQTWLATTPF